MADHVKSYLDVTSVEHLTVRQIRVRPPAYITETVTAGVVFNADWAEAVGAAAVDLEVTEALKQVGLLALGLTVLWFLSSVVLVHVPVWGF